MNDCACQTNVIEPNVQTVGVQTSVSTVEMSVQTDAPTAFWQPVTEIDYMTELAQASLAFMAAAPVTVQPSQERKQYGKSTSKYQHQRWRRFRTITLLHERKPVFMRLMKPECF